ncbi:unnamed protein product [Oncorhynchus mykiss]|uniref:Uncharacterized protein n=1 Tax=Oncorhynchus mykiss TaxID=8022 RepID=A0A060XQ24_ONCMY|nr:unnamed protein product [Oncorhynchus mykiss]
MRLRNGTVATAIIFFTSFLSLSWYTAWQNGKEKLVAYQREFHALKERLRVAEHRTLQRSSELNNILEQFRRAIAETNGSKDALINFSDETQKLLKELASRKPLQVPNIYHHMPHLLNNEGSLHPAVQVGMGRTGGETYTHICSLTYSTSQKFGHTYSFKSFSLFLQFFYIVE